MTRFHIRSALPALPVRWISINKSFTMELSFLSFLYASTTAFLIDSSTDTNNFSRWCPNFYFVKQIPCFVLMMHHQEYLLMCLGIFSFFSSESTAQSFNFSIWLSSSICKLLSIPYHPSVRAVPHILTLIPHKYKNSTTAAKKLCFKTKKKKL